MNKYLIKIAALFFSVAANGESLSGKEYVSITCPKGDISLKLLEGNSFVLELKYWSEKEHKHTHNELITGKWSYKENELQLHSKITQIYQRKKSEITMGNESSSIDSFTWVKSSDASFADTFDLVDREEIDALFNKANSKK